jgi:hypothetical protein
MKEELKKEMIGVIGSHSNALIDSIAERCAQVAIDFYEKRGQALHIHGVVGRSEQLACVHPYGDVYQSETECYCEKCGKDLTEAS